MIGEVFFGGDIADFPLDPIGAGGGGGVGHEFSVRGNFVVLERYGAIGGELVGIKEDGGLFIERGSGVEDRLILETVVFREEVATAFSEGSAEALDVPKFGQVGIELIATGNGGEVGVGDLVLRFDPIVGLLGVEILEPAVRVGDFDAVDGFLDCAGMGIRILERSGVDRSGGESGENELHGATLGNDRFKRKLSGFLFAQKFLRAVLLKQPTSEDKLPRKNLRRRRAFPLERHGRGRCDLRPRRRRGVYSRLGRVRGVCCHASG